MHPLLLIDGLVFRLLRGIIGWVDAIVPFSAKRFARILFAIYLLGDIASVVVSHISGANFGWDLLLIVLIVPAIDRVGSRRLNREHNAAQCVIRLSSIIVFGYFGVLGLIGDRHWWELCRLTYIPLVYLLDMDPKEPGERRRVLDAVRESISRPGFSTAGSEA